MTKLLLDLLWSHSCNKQIPCENTGGNSGLDFIINLCGWILSEQPRLGMENFRTERIKVRDNSNTAATSICHLSQDHSGVDKVWAGIKWRLPSWLRHGHWWESRGEFEQNKLARKETNWEVLRLLRRKYNSVSILPLIQSVSQIVSILLVFLSFPQLQIIATMSANWIKTSLRFLYLFLFLSSCPPKFGTIFEISTAAGWTWWLLVTRRRLSSTLTPPSGRRALSSSGGLSSSRPARLRRRWRPRQERSHCLTWRLARATSSRTTAPFCSRLQVRLGKGNDDLTCDWHLFLFQSTSR